MMKKIPPAFVFKLTDCEQETKAPCLYTLLNINESFHAFKVVFHDLKHASSDLYVVT